MKKILYLLFCVHLLCSCLYSQTIPQYFKYIEPLPGAKYVNKETNIIIRPYESIDKGSLHHNRAISLTGSSSGECSFSIVKSDDKQTIILKPNRLFMLGETVTVNFSPIIKSLNGKSIEPFSYNFEIKSREIKITKQYGLQSEIYPNENMNYANGYYYNDLLSDFPNITLNHYNGPSKGQLFLSDFSFPPGLVSPYLMILNNNTQPFHSIQKPIPCFDFNVQHNGNLTYYVGLYGGKYYELDSSNYAVVDSFYCGLGDSTDLHELRLLPNRHALLMSYDPQLIDMSKIVEGGYPNAIVIGLIIQEIDSKKNVVFRWRSWDHFQITDATHEDLLAENIDYVHGNAIELDYDGNIMISSRHMDEITKINRTTGEIIWRLGGKNNQFTFVNDPDRFSYQHAIRRISNGNITLYDNGNYHTPPYSRAVEYSLDETNKIATLVWQYRNTPDVYGPAMGFVQRLENGNTLISWGFANIAITEVKYNGTKVLEMSFSQGVYTYRAFKYQWKNNGIAGQIIPGTFVLEQNYPNPFNPVTTIKFGIPDIVVDGSPVNTKLSVFDVLGREVAVLLNEELTPDTYRINFDASNLASGIYFYRLATPLFKETKRMVFIK